MDSIYQAYFWKLRTLTGTYEKIEDFRRLAIDRMIKVHGEAYQRANRFETQYATPELKALAPLLDRAKELNHEERVQLLFKVASEPRGVSPKDQRLWNQAPTVVQKRAESYLREGNPDTKRLKQLGQSIGKMPKGQRPVGHEADLVIASRKQRLREIYQNNQLDRARYFEQTIAVDRG
jgi:hypothetical protein